MPLSDPRYLGLAPQPDPSFWGLTPLIIIIIINLFDPSSYSF